jgi:hypothetical protein
MKCTTCGGTKGTHDTACPYSDPTNTPAKESVRLAERAANTRAVLLSTPCAECGVAHLGPCVR